MRVLTLACLAVLLFSCNSSSKKDPGKEMDDTARMDNPPADTAKSAVINPIKISAADIPASIKVKGKMQQAWKWNDNLGENIVVTSWVAPHDVKDEFGEEAQTAEVYAVHYAKKESDADYVQIWVMNDAQQDCSLDITCEFAPGSATVTDLDNNGIAETKIQYSYACRGDVSPALMKLIMYENGVKYELNGNMWIPYSPEFKYTVSEKDVNLESSPKLKDDNDEMLRTFGRYETEKDFAAAPPQFIAFARNEWLKYSKEKMGE